MAEPTEHESQCQIFQWAEMQTKIMPELKLLSARIAGVKLSIGTWRKLLRAGYKKGSCDILLQVARCGYSSLNIELKRESGGRLSPEQKIWLSDLNKYGNLGVCVRGGPKAIEIIKAYLRNDKDELLLLLK